MYGVFTNDCEHLEELVRRGVIRPSLAIRQAEESPRIGQCLAVDATV
jgi:hypothetical protein